MSVIIENQLVATPCPGAPLTATFYDLTPGQVYTFALSDALWFTGHIAESDNPPPGLTVTKNEASFTAPGQVGDDGLVGASFTLGVAVMNGQVSGSTDITAPAVVIIKLLNGETSGQGGAFEFEAWGSFPPTCLMLYPELPNCAVCSMNPSKCPQASALGDQFYLAQHSILCCREDPS